MSDTLINKALALIDGDLAFPNPPEDMLNVGRGITTETGDLHVSSSSGIIHISGSVRLEQLSGSLTTLVDGRSYIEAGVNITVLSSSDGQITISSTAAGGGGDAGAAYVVLSATSSLSDERVLVAGTGLSLADGGAGGNATLAIDASIVATVSGTRFQNNITVVGTGSFEQGISGSLTKLADGRSYLVGGTNISVVSSSDGQITISTPAEAPADAQYLVLSTDTTLSGERVLIAGTGLSLTDGGAGGNATLAADDAVVATLSGSRFGGNITVVGTGSFEQGISGSLTRLADGRSYLVGGTNISVVSSSDGQVVISTQSGLVTGLDTSAVAIGDAVYVSATNTVEKASAEQSSLSNVLGICIADGFVATTGGPFITSFDNAGAPVAGAKVYLSYITSGALSSTEPTYPGHISVPVGICLDATQYAVNATCTIAIIKEPGEFVVDVEPPTLTTVFPTPDAINVPVSSSISFSINDNGDVVLSTINCTVSGSPAVVSGVIQSGFDGVSASIAQNGSYGYGYDITLDPTTDFSWNSIQTVSVSAVDSASNSLSNETYSFYVVTDVVGPTLTNLLPASGAVEVSQSTTIAFSLNDDASGVSLTTIQCTVSGSNAILSGTIQAAFSGTGASIVANDNHGYDVVLAQTGSFVGGSIISVDVLASDVAGNQLTSGSYSFTCTAGILPTLANLLPASNSIDVDVTSSISLTIDSTLQSAVQVFVSGSAAVVSGTIQTAFSGSGASIVQSGTSVVMTLVPTTEFNYRQVIPVSVEASNVVGVLSSSYLFSVRDATSMFVFNGIDEVLENTTGLSSSFGLASGMTISYWTYNLKDAGTVLSNATQTNNNLFHVRNVSSVLCANAFFPSSLASEADSVSAYSGEFQYNFWSHIVVRYDGTADNNANRARVWANGIEQTGSHISHAGTIPATLVSGVGVSAVPFDIAKTPGVGGTDYLNIQLGHVALWNSALSTGSIESLFGDGRITNPNSISTKPLHFWRLDATDDTTIADGIVDRGTSESKRHLTAFNMDATNITSSTPPATRNIVDDYGWLYGHVAADARHGAEGGDLDALWPAATGTFTLGRQGAPTTLWVTGVLTPFIRQQSLPPGVYNEAMSRPNSVIEHYTGSFIYTGSYHVRHVNYQIALEGTGSHNKFYWQQPGTSNYLALRYTSTSAYSSQARHITADSGQFNGGSVHSLTTTALEPDAIPRPILFDAFYIYNPATSAFTHYAYINGYSSGTVFNGITHPYDGDTMAIQYLGGMPNEAALCLIYVRKVDDTYDPATFMAEHLRDLYSLGG
jgi:hypothetical protein